MFLYLCCNADITRFISGNYHIRSSLHTVSTPPAFLTSDPDSLFGPCPGCIKVNPVTSSPKQASHTCLSLPPLKHQLTSLILRIAQLQMLSDASSPSENSPDPESPFPGVGLISTHRVLYKPWSLSHLILRYCLLMQILGHLRKTINMVASSIFGGVIQAPSKWYATNQEKMSPLGGVCCPH